MRGLKRVAASIDTGCMVMIEPTVAYEVKLQGRLAKSMFGGEGLSSCT